MKRRSIVLITVLLFIWPLLFASDASPYEMDLVGQLIIGHVDVETGLYIENDKSVYDPDDTGNGIDLDMNDSGNRYKFIIAPTDIPKTELGLRIGKFSFISGSGTTGAITITHTKLKTVSNYSQYAELEYELGVAYSLNTISGNETSAEDIKQFCLSTESVVIPIPGWTTAVYIKDGGLHFRLCQDDPVVEYGVYESTVTISFTPDSQGGGQQ